MTESIPIIERICCSKSSQIDRNLSSFVILYKQRKKMVYSLECSPIISKDYSEDGGLSSNVMNISENHPFLVNHVALRFTFHFHSWVDYISFSFLGNSEDI
jgi:hypothetical protein